MLRSRWLWIVAVAAVAAAADLSAILAKWRAVPMPYRAAGFTVRERNLVDRLVDATQYLDDIYWRQSDLAGFHLLQTTQDPKLRRLLIINGSRWDLLDENRPFVRTEPMPPGHELYPKGLTRADIERYVQAHPADKDAIYSGYTVVRRQGNRLVGIPYHQEYRALLEKAAAALRDAARFSDDPAFARFLRMRADAFLTDNYFASDLAWLDLKNPKFDVIMAPYETYLDDLLGVKTSYGASVLIRNEEESRKLEVFQKYVPQIQAALPAPPAGRPPVGRATPMEVMDAPYRGGDLRHGYQAVADNLPNDPRIHEQKGTKKIFFKNFMDARVDYVILPIAQKMMEPGQAAKVTGEGYLLSTILHEISHGLGPAFSLVNGKQVDVREAIGPAYSGLEEAKADVVGMFGEKWLVDHGVLPKDRLEEDYASYVAGLFRTLRFGTGEAHGRAEMMEFNYLSEQRAIEREANGRYRVNYSRMPGALTELARQLLAFETNGDRRGSEAWFAKYNVMPPALSAALQHTSGIPVDIDPVFDFHRPIE